MPYDIIPIKKNKCREGAKPLYKVINKDTGRVLAKNTTYQKAQSQIRLLNSIGGSINSDITKISLSGLQMKALNPTAKIMKYTELYDYDNAKDLFGDYDKIIILYLTLNDMTGHWTCLFKNKNGINYFDSYGVPLDFQFELLTQEQRHKLHEEQDYLKKMLFNEKVIYNNITYQKLHTQTCGCHVSFRLYNSDKNDLEYFNIFADNNLKPDEFVAEWCFSKLNNI
jgi:hypothetical protein